MITWNDVESHDLYKGLSPRKKRDARLRYFQKNIIKADSYTALPDKRKAAIRTEFLANPDTSEPQDSAVWFDTQKWYESGRKALGNLTLLQHPATTAFLSKEVIKGVTLGGVDLAAPNADKFLEKASKAGFVDMRKAAGVAEFAGEFMPIGYAFKFASAVTKVSKVAMTPATKAFSEGALAGLLYSYADGKIDGKSDDEIVTDMGVTGLTFGVFGGVLGKFAGWVGSKSADRAWKKAADQLEMSVDDLKKIMKSERGAVGEKTEEELFKEAAKKVKVKTGKEIAEKITAVAAFSDVDKAVTGILKDVGAGITPKQLSNSIKEVRKLIGTRHRNGDMGHFQALTAWLHSPSYLAQVHPQAEVIVRQGVSSYLPIRKRHVTTFTKIRDKALKGLNKDDKIITAQLLDKFDNVGEMTPEIIQRAGQKSIRAFQILREKFYNPIARMAKLGEYGQHIVEEGAENTLARVAKKVGTTQRKLELLNPKWKGKEIPSGEVLRINPGRIHGYLTRSYQDITTLPKRQQEQMIKAFADEANIDYTLASNILHRNIPKEAFFGPLSMSRGEFPPGMKRLWDLDQLTDMYIHGSARKIGLDAFLPIADNALSKIPEGTHIRKLMENYIKVQRGLPLTAEMALKGTVFGKIARWEALRQYISKIGMNASAVIINATQYPINDGTQAIAQALREKSTGPLADFAKGSVAILSKKARALAHRSGVSMDVGKGELNFADVRKFWDKMAEASGLLFTWVERYNKTSSYIRNYNRLQREFKGLQTLTIAEREMLSRAGELSKPIKERTIAKLTKTEKYKVIRDRALEAVGRTQFHVGVEDRPFLFIGPVGGTAGRFKIFTVKQLEMIANMDRYELAAFIGIIDVLGGPDVIPGLRELRFDLNENHPESKATKILNTMQQFSVAGVTGVDLSGKLGLGFIPGVTTSSDFWTDITENFWKTLGSELSGPTGGDVRNLMDDISSGFIDLRSTDWKSLLDFQPEAWTEFTKNIGRTKSVVMAPVGVQVKRLARAMTENENQYIEFKRKRPGYQLSENDVWKRAAGFSPAGVERQRQTLKHFNQSIDEAIKDKMDLEDKILNKDEEIAQAIQPDKRKKLVEEFKVMLNLMHEFNEEYYLKTGIRITPRSVKDAAKARELPLEERIKRNRVQGEALRKTLRLHQK